VTTWHPDFLDGYEVTDLPLPGVSPAPGEPEDVELVATLVRRLPANRSRTAVLYVHGWNDYFFQTHLADHLTDLGFDFYAVDLRRYGRSLRRGTSTASSPTSTTTPWSWTRPPTSSPRTMTTCC
jgi:pimeloyl-ACP methyl ester carboxylesterase